MHRPTDRQIDIHVYMYMHKYIDTHVYIITYTLTQVGSLVIRIDIRLNTRVVITTTKSHYLTTGQN